MPFGSKHKKSFVDVDASGGSQFAVIGMGEFGRALVLGLSEHGADVLAIDLHMEMLNPVKEHVARAVEFDATDVETLRKHGIDEMDAVVIAIGGDFEAVMLIAVELLQMGCQRILARAYTDTQRHILERVGVHEILAPESEMGYHVATLLRRPGLVDYFNLSDEYAIMEINTPEEFVGQPLDELDLPGQYDVTVITIRRPVGASGDEERQRKGEEHAGEEERDETPEMHLIGVPRPGTRLQEGDTLILFGRPDEVEKLMDDE